MHRLANASTVDCERSALAHHANPTSYFLATVFVVLLWFTPSLVAGTAQATIEPASKTIYQKWSSAISNDRADELQRLLTDVIKEGDASKTTDLKKLLTTDASNGKSALMVASKQGELAFAQHLVQLGSAVNEVTITGGTPFMFAVLGDHLPVAAWLYSQGANINAKGSNGWSAATIAAAKGQSGMMQWLISIGADINAEDVYRFTPLMRAVDNQHKDTVGILLKNGNAKVDSVDESDNTALHFAVANRQVAVVEMLLEHGADPLQPNRNGVTPAKLAEDVPSINQLLD